VFGVLVGSGRVDDGVRVKLLEKLTQQPRFGDRALDEAQPLVRTQIVAAAGREIVDGQHGIAALEQLIGEGRPDQPRSARHEYLHSAFLIARTVHEKPAPRSFFDGRAMCKRSVQSSRFTGAPARRMPPRPEPAARRSSPAALRY